MSIKKISPKFTVESTIRNVALKFYLEQLPLGEEDFFNAIKSFDSSRYEISAIKHDSDYNYDTWWQPSSVKAHYHVVIHIANAKVSPIKLRTLLKSLHIEFRPNLDDDVWAHSVEPVREYPNAIMYLTHETQKAKDEGKTLYDRSDIVSNIDEERLSQIRNGYIRKVDNTKRVDNNLISDLKSSAFEWGYSLNDWFAFYDNLPTSVQRCSSGMKVIRDYYNRGVSLGAEETDIVRCSIFISGRGGIGKSESSKRALQDMKLSIFHVRNTSGSGKWDKLTLSHQSIIADDSDFRGLFEMADDTVCEVYKRMQGSPYFKGNYLVVTSNFSFDEWARTCEPNLSEVRMDALKSRFYICHVSENVSRNERKLVCDSPNTRLSDKSVKRDGLFNDFCFRFNLSQSEFLSRFPLKDETWVQLGLYDVVPFD